MKRNFYSVFSLGLLFLITIEVSLRLIWGLGNPVLFVEDKDFEYIYAPNQHVKRFGYNINTNEYSMRSTKLSKADKIRILKIGDSIINGGTLTDDDSLASSLLEKELTLKHQEKIRVLNISAGSWGPDNAYAYIQKYGAFNAGLFVLVFSSHDLYDTMEHEKIVGKDVSYPSKKPCFAIQELICRYFIPYIVNLKNSSNSTEGKKLDNLQIGNQKSLVNTGWQHFFNYTKENNIQLLVVLHPTLEEVHTRTYDGNGKVLVGLLKHAKVPYILELNNAPTSDLYRDDIHYNNKGQKFLAKELFPYLESYVNTKPKTVARPRQCSKVRLK